MKKEIIYVRKIYLVILLLGVSFSFSQNTTCGTNCDINVSAGGDVSSEKDLTAGNDINGDGFTTLCLNGDLDGFDHTGRIKVQANSKLYICETNDNSSIDISGSIEFLGGGAQINVVGTTNWSNPQIVQNTTEFNISSDGSLNLTKSLQIKASSSFNNFGYLKFKDNIELSDNVTITNSGTLEIKKQLTAMSNNGSTLVNTGSVTIGGAADLRNNTLITNSGDLTFNGTSTFDGGDLTNTGDVVFNNTATIKNGATVNSTDSMVFNSTTFSTGTTSLTNSGYMSFSQNADFKDGMTVTNSSDMIFDANLILTNVTMSNTNKVYVGGNMTGGNSSTFTNEDSLIVDGNMDQDFKLVNLNRIEVGGDLSMENEFDNRGGIFVDGDLSLKPDKTNFFDQGFFVSESITFGGSGTFGSGSSTCALFISRQPINNSGINITENAGKVAFISESTVTDDNGTRFADFDTLENVSFTLPVDITDADYSDFTDTRFQDYLTNDCAFDTDGDGIPDSFHPLPILLVEFVGEAKYDFNTISFTTSEEIDSDYILLEKSTDGRDWYQLKLFKSEGNSFNLKDYTYDDYNRSATSYYRLKQVDIDGSIVYSPSIVVISEMNDYYTVLTESVYSIFSNSSEDYIVLIYTLSGQELFRGNNTSQIDLSSFPKEVLIARINNSFVEKISNF